MMLITRIVVAPALVETKQMATSIAEDGPEDPALAGNPEQAIHDLYQSADSADGAGTRSRTRDLLITSQLLYQLSYAGRIRSPGPHCTALSSLPTCESIG